MKISKFKLPVIFICVALFVIPFFWLKPGEMDLGGDSGRLYFYDPQALLKSNSLYSIDPEGIGNVESIIYILPFLILTSILKIILHSPYIIISLFNILKLTVGFITIYAIIKELLEIKDRHYEEIRELAAIIGGLFYIFSPMFIGNFDRALLIHDQVFLNPLIFYLLLKYLLTSKGKYLWFTLIITFIFAHNFSWLSVPPLFAFYPLSLLFLLLYTTFIRRKKLPWKAIFAGLLIFVGLHSFHLIPAIISLFDPGSNTNTRVFNREDITHQLDYFYGVLPIASISKNIFFYSDLKQFGLLSVLVPLLIISGLLFNTKNLPVLGRGKKTLLLTGIFFLIVLFLLSAKITNLGVNFYAWMFLYVPGFSMFRNFIGQWQFVFYFFYVIFFGQALFFVLSKLSKKYVVVLSAIAGLSLVLSGWPFINGSLVNKVHFQSNGVKYAIVMDPKYEKTLSYIKSLPEDAKILTLPFTDCCYQVIHGTNNGAYVGLSTISFLSGKKDFSGYIKIAPFSEIFLKLARERDYDSIKRMLGLLNIQYIFYNADPRIYDTTFPGYPYQYVRHYLPADQKTYGKFVKNLGGQKVFEKGPYRIYELDNKDLLPHFYTALAVRPYEQTSDYWDGKKEPFFVGDKDLNKRVGYIDKNTCNNIFSVNSCDEVISYGKNFLPKIYFEKINPTRYRLKINGAKDPYILVFSESFHKNWKIISADTESQQKKTVKNYFDGKVTEGVHSNSFLDESTFYTWGKKAIANDRHFRVNGYANAWNITPQDTGGKENYELIVEMTGQRIFYVSLALSLIVFLGCLLWGVISLVKGSWSDIIRRSND